MPNVAHQQPPFYRRKPSRRALSVSAVLLIALLVLILLFDWNWFKGPIEQVVQARTGRAFHIRGNLDVDLGMTTTIKADDLSFGNAPWSKQEDMASADRAEIEVQLWPLIFRRQAHLPEIRLSSPRLHLETGLDGVGNWDFGQPSQGNKMQLDRLWIENGRLQFFNTRERTSIDVTLNSAKAEAKDSSPAVDIKGKGRWTGSPFTLSGQIESPLELSSVPTLFEQIQLISQICRNFVLDGSRKQLIQRDSLEHRQAQDL